MASDSKNLVATLQKIRLLEPADLAQINGLQARHPDAKGLGAELIRAGLLTPFQVNHLLQGRCADLVLGPYRLLDRIGEGGMGQVFKARHERMGRIVAIKVIRKDKLADPLALDRFRRETHTAAQLDHPNIVHALDADSIGACHLLVMEFVDGIDLSQLVKRSGPLPIRAAADYILQAALGLQHAHEKGIVHRDIKPSNILVSKTSGSGSMAPGQQQRPWGLIKILDMGLARLQDPSGENSTALTMTQTGSVVGTPDFIAPEQARSSRQTDGRSDIYSLGCTFYYLLTGQVPFPTGTVTEKLLHHVMDEPRPVEQLRPDLPPELAKIVRKLMDKQPDNRFQTPTEVAAALEAWSQGKVSKVPANPRNPFLRPAGLAAALSRGRRWILAGAVGFALLLVLFLSAVFAFRSGSPTTNKAVVDRDQTRPAATQQQPSPDRLNPAGSWRWSHSFGGKRSTEWTLRLSTDGDRLTGTMSGREGRSGRVDDVVLKDGTISFTLTRERKERKFISRYEGKLSGDTIKGKSTFEFGGQSHTMDWEAKRVKE